MANASSSSVENYSDMFFCDRHPHNEASAIADCAKFHRLCAQCMYDTSVFEAAESGDKQTTIRCSICEQTTVSNEEEDFVDNKEEEEVTKVFLKLGITEKKVDADPADIALLMHMPTELHAELMHFLDMGNLRKMVSISRLPYTLFGDKMRKWKARNEWFYSMEQEETRQREIFEISQHGLSVCKGNDHYVASVHAKKPFKLAGSAVDSKDLAAAASTIRRFYFEIRVQKSTGPIIFGLVERRFYVDASWKWRMEAIQRHAESRVQRRPELHREYFHKNRFMWHPCFLANDIAAWPRVHWEECLNYFARQSLVSVSPDGTPLGGKFTDGDVLGCGLLKFPEMTRHQLFFTRNGQLFGEPTWVSPDKELLFPFVSLVSAGTSVSANFGYFDKFPHTYNIEQHKSPFVLE